MKLLRCTRVVLVVAVATSALAACAMPTALPPPVADASSGSAAAPPTLNGMVLRSDADLRTALLRPEDLPSGFTVYPESGPEDYAVFASTIPKCRAFVSLSNQLVAPGTKASADVTLAAKVGSGTVVVSEWLDAFGSPAMVAGQLRPMKAAIAACPKVTVTVPGAGTGTATLAMVKPPKVGVSPLAWQFAFTSGKLKGFVSTSIATGIGDATLHLQFSGISSSTWRGSPSSPTQRPAVRS